MSETEKTISVIIPVYNTADYLPRCLDSVINSDYRNLEIICVNDGSTDNSLDILNEYAEKDSRIRVITIPNGGVSIARNTGLDAASGDYIAFVDSDDRIHKQYFSVLVDIQRKSGCDIAAVTYKEADEHVQDGFIDVSAVKAKFYKNDKALRRLFRAVWTKLFKREILQGLRFCPETHFAEDTLFLYNIFWNKKSVNAAIADLPIYFYTVRNNSLSHNGREIPGYLFSHRKYLKFADIYSDKRISRICLKELFRYDLPFRYGSARSGKTELFKEIDEVMNKAVDIDREKHILRFPSSVLYRALTKRPKLYEKYRKILSLKKRFAKR